MGTALSGLFARNIPGGLLILPQPCADAPFPGTLPARELFAEILGLEDLADLDLGLVTSPGCGLGHFLAHAMASSSEAHFQIQKPATRSLASVNGPSTTVRLLSFENLTRAPFELG